MTTKLALDEFTELAQNGHSGAQYNLGLMYNNGNGVGRDMFEALDLWRRAAVQGHASAQYNLGLLYEGDDEIAEDFLEAARWYRSAAEQGHANAQNNLGLLYESGYGLDRNKVLALMDVVRIGGGPGQCRGPQQRQCADSKVVSRRNVGGPARRRRLRGKSTPMPALKR